MAYASLDALVQDLQKHAVVLPSQLDECWEELNRRTARPEELLTLLIRKGHLTSLQKERIDKDEMATLLLGKYLIRYKIASGSFGRVYRGADRHTRECVAVKVLRERWSSDPRTIELFQREGKVGMTLHHPNIVEILEVNWDKASNRHYMAMEFVQGGSLREILTSHKKLPPDKALMILEGAAAGLAYAQQHRLSHRDIKMSNILISVDGTAKLVDFGLAASMPTNHQEMRNGSQEVERTIEYAGLEKASGVQPGDSRSDIFFLGCVAFEMLSGRAPLRRPRDRNDRMSASRFSQVPQLTGEDVKAPQSLYHLVSTMMAFNPAQRYQTSHQLVEAIHAVRRDLRTAGQGDSEHSPGQRTVLVVEGDDKLQEKLRDAIRSLGYRPRVASHPVSALDLYRKQPFDGILINVGTAGQEGLQVSEQLQAEANRQGRTCAAILVLAQDQATWKAQVKQSPHVAVLVRPVKPHDLLNKLKELVPLPSGRDAG